MSLSADEKKCLKLATDFQTEAAKQINFRRDKTYPETVLVAAGPFLGEITADKYRQCMAEQGRSKTQSKTR